MAYSAVPTVTTGDVWTAANHNTYVRDNFAAGVPDIFTAKGDLAVGSGADVAVRLPVGSDGKTVEADSAQTLGMKYGWGWPLIGLIILWYGSTGSIPTGWQLCNGTNGTPDLRDKFVVGAGSTYAVGATGGAATHTHTQGNTGNESGHNHFVNGNTGIEDASNILASGALVVKSYSHIHSLNITSAGGSAHLHTNPPTAAGSSLAPYHALCYIQKMSES